MFSRSSYSDFIHKSLHQEIKDFPDEWFGVNYEDVPDFSIVVYYENIPKDHVKGNNIFIVKTNDIHYFNDNAKACKVYTYETADYIIGPYTDTIRTVYNIPPEKLACFPHSAAVEYQAPQPNETPIPKVFMYGAIDHKHYPLRNSFANKMAGSDIFVRAAHPGYESKTSTTPALLRNHMCSYSTGAFPLFEIPEENHTHYLLGKCVEIMCSGVLLLTDDISIVGQLADLGIHDKIHYIYSETLELNNTISYILDPSNRPDIDTIRKSGWEKCISEHTSAFRCSQIAEWLRSIATKETHAVNLK